MQRKKYEIDILRLKIALQDLFDAQEQLQIGTSELNVVLMEFRERIDEDLVKAFDENFFGTSQGQDKQSKPQVSSSTDIVVQENRGDTAANLKSKKSVALPWAKKMYKSIVQRTHPDRFIDFPIEALKEKFTKIYIAAVKAYEELDYGTLLLCAYESEVKYSDVPEAQQYINDSLQNSKKEISRISMLLAYQWYHLDDLKKMTSLENYLRQQGYKFDRKKAQEVIRRVASRKVGQRPQKNMRVKRKKIK